MIAGDLQQFYQGHLCSLCEQRTQNGLTRQQASSPSTFGRALPNLQFAFFDKREWMLFVVQNHSHNGTGMCVPNNKRVRMK